MGYHEVWEHVVEASFNPISLYRVLTYLGLKNSRELMEKVTSILKKRLSQEEEEHLVDKLKAVGANTKLICSLLTNKIDKYSSITNYKFQIITSCTKLRAN